MSSSGITRLSAVDTSFLVQEHAASHMHIGGVVIFEGPMPDIEKIKAHVESRLHYIPRFRQRIAVPRFQAGRPFWVDDQRFNLDYHVRDTALPAPGNDEQLERLAARIFSQRLDRRKPLWELWFVDGLSGGRFAMINKSHHAMIDGMAGIDVATVLFDLEPNQEVTPAEPWRPRQTPTQSDLIAEGVRDVMRAPLKIAKRTAKAIENPAAARADIAEVAGGALRAVSETLGAAPRAPLNADIGPHRRYEFVRCSLADFKDIKDMLGGTVNDAVLTVVADGLGRWLRGRYFPTNDLRLRALVPVSTRGKKRGTKAESGNELVAMRGILPVGEMDILERHTFVKNAMDDLKSSNQAVAASVLTAVQSFAPPSVLAQASRLNFSTRLFNLLVTNVPGPQIPLYLLGRPAIDSFPIPFLAQNHGLAVAVMSYNGGLNFGLLGDYDVLHDLDALAAAIADSRDDLLDAAREVRDKVHELQSDPAIQKKVVAAKKAEAVAKSGNATASRAKAPRKVNPKSGDPVPVATNGNVTDIGINTGSKSGTDAS